MGYKPRKNPITPELYERAKRIFLNTEMVVDENGCHNWPKSTEGIGYGQINLKDKNRKNVRFKVHRLSYELAKGEIGSGLFVCHRCDNPSCNNPEHLFLGTEQENFADMRAKGRHQQGERHPRAKLLEGEVAEIRWYLTNTKMSQPHIASFYGVSDKTIGNIKTGKIWKHVVAKAPDRAEIASASIDRTSGASERADGEKP